MSKKIIQLSIPKPCNEGWENMLPEEKGRFCLTCQKSVIDFSNLSNNQIASILSENSGRVCGRFTINQLNKNIVIENNSQQNKLLKAASFLIPLFVSTNVQAIPNLNTIETVQFPNFEESLDVFPLSDSTRLLTIIVKDEQTGELLPFVSIFIDNVSKATTDIDGKAQLLIHFTDKKIEINSVGYKSILINVESISASDKILEVSMNNDEILIEGDIILVSKVPKWWQFRKKRAYKRELKNV